MWHYLTMNSQGPRLTMAIIAPILLTSVLAGPALASQTAPAATIEASLPTSATPSPSQSQDKPNVGDDTPKGFEFEKHENFLTDESGLIALGLAALIGVGTAVLVKRTRRKSSLY